MIINFDSSLTACISKQEEIIREAVRKIELLKKISLGGVYLLTLTGNRTKYYIMEINDVDVLHDPCVEGYFLAENIKTPTNHWEDTDYSKFNYHLKFIKDIEPFDPDSAPLIINWEWVSEKFKKRYFKKE